MNLVIDIGNTRTKFFVFDGEELAISVPVDEFKAAHIGLFIQDYPQISRAILSSVKEYPDTLKKALHKSFDTFIELDAKTPLPIKNNYKNKDTLGNDRVAAVVAANFLYPGFNVLVIDAGTAITYDIINAEGNYLGGNISPGINMRYKALHAFTGKLPLIEAQDSRVLFGNSTETAIRAGVQNGVIYEVENTISTFNECYNNLQIIITGGDANFFDKKLKNSFFVNFNLTGIGLNRILNYNGDIKKS